MTRALRHGHRPARSAPGAGRVPPRLLGRVDELISASAAMRLTANDNIQARVDELMAKAAAKAGVTVERIVADLDKIAFSDIRKALGPHDPVSEDASTRPDRA